MNLLKYSLLRLGLMLAVFVLCYWLGIGLIFSGLFAILLAFAVAYLVFPGLHLAAGADLRKLLGSIKVRKNRVEEENREIEDQYVDAQRRQEGSDL